MCRCVRWPNKILCKESHLNEDCQEVAKSDDDDDDDDNYGGDDDDLNLAPLKEESHLK